MPTLYATTGEIKAHLGISGTANDNLIGSLNRAAEGVLNGIIGVDTLERTTHTDEPAEGEGDFFIMVRHFPFVSLTTVKDHDGDTITPTTFNRAVGRQVWTDEGFHDKGKYQITYVAGYTLQDTLQVTAYASIASGAVITATRADGADITLTEGTDWNAATDDDTTASSIQSAFDTALSGSATVSTDTVTTAKNLNISMSDETGVTLTVKTIPEEIKMALAYIVGGMIEAGKTTSKGVVSYTLGGKTVNFRNAGEADATRRIVDQYLAHVKKITVRSV